MGIIGVDIFKREAVAEYKSVKSRQANKPDVELSIERDGKRKETRNSVKKKNRKFPRLKQKRTTAFGVVYVNGFSNLSNTNTIVQNKNANFQNGFDSCF